MKDWLGKEYNVGDLVLYSKSYGGNHGVQTLLARVKRINGTSVTAEVLSSSRGGSRKGKVKIDLRTGKPIDTYSPLHRKTQACFRVKATGEIISDDERYKLNPAWANRSLHNPGGYYKYGTDEVERVPETYWDYVAEVDAYPVTTFRISDNITKVDEGFADIISKEVK